MADTITKCIAARLPLDEYVKVLKQASDAKLSVSDYIITKLYATNNNDTSSKLVIDLKNKLAQEQQKVAGLTSRLSQVMIDAAKAEQSNQYIEQLQKEKESLKSEISVLTSTSQKQQAQIKELIQKCQSISQEGQASVMDLKSTIQKLQKDQDAHRNSIYRMRNELANLHNGSSAFGTLPEKYWLIIDKYIPALKIKATL